MKMLIKKKRIGKIIKLMLDNVHNWSVRIYAKLHGLLNTARLYDVRILFMTNSILKNKLIKSYYRFYELTYNDDFPMKRYMMKNIDKFKDEFKKEDIDFNFNVILFSEIDHDVDIQTREYMDKYYFHMYKIGIDFSFKNKHLEHKIKLFNDYYVENEYGQITQKKIFDKYLLKNISRKEYYIYTNSSIDNFSITIHNNSYDIYDFEYKTSTLYTIFSSTDVTYITELMYEETIRLIVNDVDIFGRLNVNDVDKFGSECISLIFNVRKLKYVFTKTNMKKYANIPQIKEILNTLNKN